METKQHATIKPMGQWENWKHKNTLRQSTMKIQPIQSLWNEAKVVLRSSEQNRPSWKKPEKSQINNLTYHINELQKEEHTKPKFSRRNEIIKK